MISVNTKHYLNSFIARFKYYHASGALFDAMMIILTKTTKVTCQRMKAMKSPPLKINRSQSKIANSTAFFLKSWSQFFQKVSKETLDEIADRARKEGFDVTVSY